MRKKDAPTTQARGARRPKDNLNSRRFPSEKQQERKQPAGNLSAEAKQILRR